MERKKTGIEDIYYTSIRLKKNCNQKQNCAYQR